jgi:eukaryotic-like serine/threonine-protein kinase
MYLRFSCAFLLPTVLCAADPVMFRNDAAHTGVYISDKAPSLTEVLWRSKTGAKILSSPTVFGETVYIGSSDRHLYAVNKSDGALRWKFETKGPIRSSPAVSGDSVYFMSEDGNFYALEAAGGRLKWQYKTAGEHRFTAPGIHGAAPSTEMMPDPYDTFLSSPAVAGGLVYFGSGDSNVYALDAASGSLRWKVQTGNVVHSSPAVWHDTVYVGSWDSYLYALNAETGAVKWKFKTGDDEQNHNQVGIASSPAVADGAVFFGCRDGHLYAVDAVTGKERWNHDNKMGWIIASPAVLDGVVYFPTSDGTKFKALEAKTGKLLYELMNKTIAFSSPAVAAGVVYFGTFDGWVHGVDAKSGQVKYQFQTDASKKNLHLYADAQGRINEGALYPDFSLDGMVIGLEKMYSLGAIVSSPSVADGVLFVGSTDGYLYALK